MKDGCPVKKERVVRHLNEVVSPLSLKQVVTQGPGACHGL